MGQKRVMTLGELFTEQQFKKAAEIFQSMGKLESPHDRLVAMLEPDKARFDELDVHIPWAAYLLESHRNLIIHVYL